MSHPSPAFRGRAGRVRASSWRACLYSALALASARGAAGAEVQGFHYTREVEVPSPGWVQVPLDLAAIQHLAPGGADLHVFSAAGAEVPIRIEPASPRSERRAADSFRVESAADGWLLSVDLGADPVPHERLFLSPARPPLPPPDRIESSPDGAVWQPLAAGEPSPGESAGEIAVSYPVTAERYLRLHWPRRPEAPRIATAEVEAVTGPTLSIASPRADCEEGPPGSTFCTLALPATGQTVRRLAVEIEGKGVVGYRLYAPREARWRPLTEGVWQPVGGRVHHLIALAAGVAGTPPEPVAGSVLRLELHAAGTRPRLASYGVDLTVQTILFHADEPGTHTLAYGGAQRTGLLRRLELPPGARTVWLEPRAESEHSLSYLPAAATAPAVRLESRRLAASWRIVAPSAKPGTLVRLELPAVVYGAARADLGNLRVTAGERQVPFQHWSPEDPELAAQEQDLRLQGTGRRSGDSSVEIHLPQPGLPLTQAELTAPPLPLRRTVGVRYLEPTTTPAREVRRRERPVIVHDTWECRPQPPLPCRELLPLPGRAPSVFEVSVHDGNNPPLAGLGAALWRRRDVLLFVWPETEEPVRLVVGPDTLPPPSYDLQALGDALLSYPWQPAELSQGSVPPRVHPWWSRWMRPMILFAAIVGLLLLLRRILGDA